MNEFKPGTMAVYSEDGNYFEVEIVETNHTDDFWYFTLRSLRNLIAGSLVTMPPWGEKFEVNQTKHYSYGGMWHLWDVATIEERFDGTMEELHEQYEKHQLEQQARA